MKNPDTIQIGVRRSPAETITHALYPVDVGQKQELLAELLERTEYDQVLIFCRTKNGADRVARRLTEKGHSVAVLHSNRTQREREQALNGFRNGRYEVMVATDIAARHRREPSAAHPARRRLRPARAAMSARPTNRPL